VKKSWGDPLPDADAEARRAQTHDSETYDIADN
jgi:hypothetical protein